MVGKELNHYKVLSPLGKGGMGEVYLAEDSKLHRKVALKVLPSEMAADPERLSRFQREARAVAALNHPNVITIYSVEEDDGVHFLTMELVDGESLAEILTGEGLGLQKLLAIAIPLAEALSAAHAKGITHRDLKPPNVMVSHDGRVKVLDFGLAKFLEQCTGGGPDSELATEARTQEGMIVGTVPYMSPEQVEGRATDQRSDIFSLGIMLYEMATGRRPFQGESAIALLSSILKDVPSPVSELTPDLPAGLSAIIARCLAKDPNARYQDGQDLFRELSQIEATPSSEAVGKSVPSEAPWVVVQPFKTKAAELDSFADGLTEDITAGLSRFPHLNVVSASSSSRSNERFTLEGSIRKAGQSIRVSVKLLDAATGTHLWAEHFDRDHSDSDIFTAQDELTDRVVATVADPMGVLTRALWGLVKAKPMDELSAHECVLGMFAYWEQMRADEHGELRAALERALEAEPRHADAQACLSLLYLDEFKQDYNVRPDPLDRALATAQRAVELDATSQLAYRALAEACYYRKEQSAFRPAADRVIALNPRETVNVGMIGLLIAYSGDWTTGCSVVRKVMALNPHHVGWLHFVFAFDHYRKQEYEKALEAAEKINLPGYYWFHILRAAINAQLGRTDIAREHMNNGLELVPEYARQARSSLSRWFVSIELVDHLVEGLEKAGLEVG